MNDYQRTLAWLLALGIKHETYVGLNMITISISNDNINGAADMDIDFNKDFSFKQFDLDTHYN